MNLKKLEQDFDLVATCISNWRSWSLEGLGLLEKFDYHDFDQDYGLLITENAEYDESVLINSKWVLEWIWRREEAKGGCSELLVIFLSGGIFRNFFPAIAWAKIAKLGWVSMYNTNLNN